MENSMFMSKIKQLLVNRFGDLASIMLEYYKIPWRDLIVVNCMNDNHIADEWFLKFSGVVIDDRAYICPNRISELGPGPSTTIMYGGRCCLVEYEEPIGDQAHIDRLEGVAHVLDVDDDMYMILQWGDQVHGIHSVPLVTFWDNPVYFGGDMCYVLVADTEDDIEKKCEAVVFDNHPIGPIVGYIK
jgi:hypothetical protein